jgi:hypothetical protein
MRYELEHRTRAGTQKLRFPDKRARGRYLAQKKNEAKAMRREFTFKRNEYLRVYRNAILCEEYDIVKNTLKIPY